MKIYEITKPLNPEAKEWRPTEQPLLTLSLLPHAFSQSPPPPPPLKLLYHPPKSFHYHYFLSHTVHTYLPQPLHTTPFPATYYSDTTADAATPTEEAEIKILEPENKDSIEQEKEKKVSRAKSATRSCRDVKKKFLPPRLRSRRPLSSRNDANKRRPSPPKQEWRCKRPESATSSSVSLLPPPPKEECRLKNDPLSPTTVMIRNIPNQIRRSFLLKFLDHYCKIYSLEYDLLYLPIDFSKLGNLGYAFVNFTTAAAANKVKNILCNYKWRSFRTDDGEAIASNKVVEITWARIQGKEALVRRFQNSNFKCTDPEFLPVVLDPPRNGTDPNPPPPLNLGKCWRPPVL